MLEKRAKVTYFFQVKKCDDQSCPHHKPLRGNHTVDVFPDRVPNEVDGILHYKEGVDPTIPQRNISLQFLKMWRNPHMVSPSAQQPIR